MFCTDLNEHEKNSPVSLPKKFLDIKYPLKLLTGFSQRRLNNFKRGLNG